MYRIVDKGVGSSRLFLCSTHSFILVFSLRVPLRGLVFEIVRIHTILKTSSRTGARFVSTTEAESSLRKAVCMKKRNDSNGLVKGTVRFKVGDPVRLIVAYDGCSTSGVLAPYGKDSIGTVVTVERYASRMTIRMKDREHEICVLKSTVSLCGE